MSSELVPVTVRIYGWDYILKVESTEIERAKALADYLDQRMHQIAKNTGSADTLKIAIRSALTIIDELFTALEPVKQSSFIQTKALEKSESTDWENKLDELTKKIDKELLNNNKQAM